MIVGQYTDHGLSHLSEGGDTKVDRRKTWGMSIRWKVEQFAYLLDKMKQPLGNGRSLLDDSIVVCSSEMSAVDHSTFNLPIIVAGKVPFMSKKTFIRYT